MTHMRVIKTWDYRGRVIEEDFESWSLKTKSIFLKRRTGYIIRRPVFIPNFEFYEPGKYRTLREAKAEIDRLTKVED
jgi:hypothetical protein